MALVIDALKWIVIAAWAGLLILTIPLLGAAWVLCGLTQILDDCQGWPENE